MYDQPVGEPARVHLTAMQVECPECEAPEGEGCEFFTLGMWFPSTTHEAREDAADRHVLEEHGSTPEGDQYYRCVECDWEGTD